MNILIAGGTGEIGTNLIPKLLKHNITVISRRPQLYDDKRINHIECDITDFNMLVKNKEIINKNEILINLVDDIVYSRNIIYSLKENIKVSVFGTINLIGLMTKLNQIIYSSSYSVYGNPEIKPVTEEGLINPRNTYAIGKITTEHMLRMYSTENNIPASILRISSVYGPNTPAQRLIPTIIKKCILNDNIEIYGDGTDSRDYVHVEDVTRSILLCLEKKSNGVFNIGSGSEISVNDLVRRIKMLNSKYVKEVIYKQRNTNKLNIVLDITKANRELNYYPKNGVYQYLEKTMREHLS